MFTQQDDEIVLDICACLITILQEHSDLSALILELGFISRIRENLEFSHVTPAVYELSLLVLCAILRGPSILHRTVVLAVRDTATSTIGGTDSYSGGGGGSMGGFGTAVPHMISSPTLGGNNNTMDLSVFSFDSAATEGADAQPVLTCNYVPGTD